MLSPYRPRHRRCQAAHGRLSGPRAHLSRLSGGRGRLSPSDTLFAILSAAVLLLVAFTVGALVARPF